jgi:alpha-tubulin suppressor-like RCC1 family protein
MKCWGKNDQGQLGTGTPGTKLTPTAVSAQTTVNSVSAGAQNSCFVSTTGSLSCSGRAALNGNSPAFSTASYSQVGALSTWTLSSIGYSVGTDVEALGLRSATTGFFGWGLNSFGQLGDGTTTAHATPTGADAAAPQNWSSVSTGDTSCGIGGAGSLLWCWGNNAFGAVGVGSTASASFSTPQNIDNLNAWVAVSVGHGGSVCGIRGTSGSGGLYCWGNPANGRLGNGTTTVNVTSPTQISDGGTPHTDWTAISVGTGHACGIRSGASGLFCWGLNTNGQVGDGTTADKTTPTAVTVGASLNVARVNAGDVHTCAVTSGGALYCWGDNSNGLLGTGTKTGNSGTNQTAPLQIGSLLTWSRVAVGKTDTYATQGTALWDWGLNDQGQLGDGTAFNGTPQAITVP